MVFLKRMQRYNYFLNKKSFALNSVKISQITSKTTLTFFLIRYLFFYKLLFVRTMPTTRTTTIPSFQMVYCCENKKSIFYIVINFLLHSKMFLLIFLIFKSFIINQLKLLYVYRLVDFLNFIF